MAASIDCAQWRTIISYNHLSVQLCVCVCVCGLTAFILYFIFFASFIGLCTDSILAYLLYNCFSPTGRNNINKRSRDGERK